jgi:hypothetical protein
VTPRIVYQPTDEGRAKLIAALASIPPLTCADCGASVPLQRSVVGVRDGVRVDLCAVCALLRGQA